jgi:hypothetical protein
MRFSSNASLAQAWASGNYKEGRTGNASASFRGPSFYSYYTQLAERLEVGGNVVYIVGDGSYSTTTAGKHYPALWSAIGYSAHNVVHVEASPWGGNLPLLGREPLNSLLDYYERAVRNTSELYHSKLGGSNYPTKGKNLEDLVNASDASIKRLLKTAELLDGWRDISLSGVESSIRFKGIRHYYEDIKSRLTDDLKDFRDKRAKTPNKGSQNALSRQTAGAVIDTFRKEFAA